MLPSSQMEEETDLKDAGGIPFAHLPMIAWVSRSVSLIDIRLIKVRYMQIMSLDIPSSTEAEKEASFYVCCFHGN